jgi:hypothetical protein
MTAVQSKDTVIIDLLDIRKRKVVLNLFDFVEFKYSEDNHIARCIIIDRYFLDSEQKAKALIIKRKTASAEKYINNVVYKVEKCEDDEQDKVDNFVGTIIDKSDISQIRFEYSSKKFLTDGDLLKIEAKNKEGNKVDILYQVTEAITDIKNFENKNEIGLIVANATQLGVWQEKHRNFESYGWVPRINTPIYIASDVKGPEQNKNEEILLGTIEDTKFNVLANIEGLVTHHTAILGTTGSGKSVFSRKLIKELAENNNKVFCVDLTGETKKYLKTTELINSKKVFKAGGEVKSKNNAIIRNTDNSCNHISEHIKNICEFSKCDFGKNPVGYDEFVSDVEEYMKSELLAFINNSSDYIGVFELPELSNTDETLEYTKFFFKALFDLAKEGAFKDSKACIVLEEAHTLIPEWNSVGGTDEKTARRVTNTIAQIALQGRKYNVGLLVIAQRTANVSKTILTQCNTIISFKQFDNTSKDFLTNHFGPTFVTSLPILKKQTAIISGKALVSDVPIILKVPHIEETEIQQTEQNAIEE